VTAGRHEILVQASLVKRDLPEASQGVSRIAPGSQSAADGEGVFESPRCSAQVALIGQNQTDVNQLLRCTALVSGLIELNPDSSYIRAAVANWPSL